MSDLLTKAEQEVLLRCVNDSIECQAARVEIEQRSLDNLLLLRGEIEQCRLPGEIEQTRNGMVTLDLLNSVKKKERR